MKPFLATEWFLFMIGMSIAMERCASFKDSNHKASCHKLLSDGPLIVEEDDPYAESVRVLSDAIKRQAIRNSRAGHDLVKGKMEALEKHETFHADHFSEKLALLGEKLRKAEEKAELAQEAIDKERLRHAKAKQKIEQTAEERVSSLQEQEEDTIERQHQAEDKIHRAEKKLEQEEAELKQARKHHQKVLELAQLKEQEAKRLIEQEKEQELADEEAAEAREEVAETNG